MRLTNILLPLPAPLLLLIATFRPSAGSDDTQSPAQWPYNLPAHVKYWPEDPPHRRRDLEAIEQHILAGKEPIGIKKMGINEREKFFVEYWNFEDTYQSSHFEDEYSSLDDAPKLSKLRPEGSEGSSYLNDSMSLSFRHPFALHQNEDLMSGRKGLAALFGRGSLGFTCPTGTASCVSINQPNACCATDETCFIITDTGLGDVGCCPNGVTCTGQDISCPTNEESCPDSTGGGCCIPGFVCDGPGCIPSQSVVTVVTTITIIAPSSTHIITTTTVESNSISAVVSATIGSNSITIVKTGTAIQTTLACSPSYQACPVNQGGGCCLTGRECGLTDCPLASGSATASTQMFTTATGSAVVPVRPTSSTITVFSSTGSNSAIATGSCPVGFYGCSAVHEGGCCRTGRNCATTDCPAIQETTIISAGETIVVPVGTAASLGNPGGCASGWYDCLDVDGGGCCPSGYNCGIASCTLYSGAATVRVGPKGTAVIVSNGAGRSRRIGMKGWLGGVVGVCWVGGVVMILMLI